MSIDISFLATIPWFNGINEEELRKLIPCLGYVQKDYEANEIVFLQDQEIKYIGLIITGKISTIKIDLNGHQSTIMTLEKGDIFGETFLCNKDSNSKLTYVAITSCKVIYFPFHKVFYFCSMACPFHHRLIENTLSIISDKNVKLLHKIEILSAKTLRDKIKLFLKQISIQQGCNTFSISLTRSDIADYICADRSSLCRELSRMQKDGLIEYAGNKFRIFF